MRAFVMGKGVIAIEVTEIDRLAAKGCIEWAAL